MGCDIHLHIEIRVNGIWHHYAAPYVQRWYALFERMAGVRGDVHNAIAPPRGLPDDATVVTKLASDDMGSDGHSHSWLSSAEVVVLDDWLGEQEEKLKPEWPGYNLEHAILHTYLFENGFAGFVRYPKDGKRVRALGLADFRFVFWFDN